MKLRLALLAVFALLAWPSAAAPSPSMGWGQWTSADLTFTECYLRASAALEAEGLKPENYGRFWFGGSPGEVSATIVCYPLPRGTMVTISASNEGGNSGLSGDMVGRLAGRIFTTEKPKPSPGTAVTPTSPPGQVPVVGGSWAATAGEFDECRSGGELTHDVCHGSTRFRFTCPRPWPKNLRTNPVFGTDIYWIGSPVCQAAIHAGLITAETGGSVLIQIVPVPPLSCPCDPSDPLAKNGLYFHGSKRNGYSSLGAYPDHLTKTKSAYTFVGGSEAQAKVAAAEAQSWTGTWATSFGTMQLIQSNGAVTGAYTHASGQISGNLAGNVLKGTWTQAPTRKGKDAGTFEFTLARDGKSFSGRWRYTGDSTWNATPWTGTCTAGPCKS